MKRPNFLPATIAVAISLSMMVACGPQSREPQARLKDISAATAGEDLKSKAVEAQAKTFVQQKRATSGVQVDAKDADAKALALIQNVEYISNDANQKILITTADASGNAVQSILILSADKSKFSNDSDASAAQKFTAFVQSADKTATVINIYSDSTKGQVKVKVTSSQVNLKAVASPDSDQKVHVGVKDQTGSEPVATSDQMTLIKKIETDLSGAATIKTLKLQAVSDTDGNVTLTRTFIDVNKKSIVIEKASANAATVVAQDKSSGYNIIAMEQSSGMINSSVDIGNNFSVAINISISDLAAVPAPSASAVPGAPVPDAAAPAAPITPPAPTAPSTEQTTADSSQDLSVDISGTLANAKAIAEKYSAGAIAAAKAAATQTAAAAKAAAPQVDAAAKTAAANASSQVNAAAAAAAKAASTATKN